jgi:hypothetical protein
LGIDIGALRYASSFSAFFTASLWSGVCQATRFPTPSSRSFSGGGWSIQSQLSLRGDAVDDEVELDELLH